MKTRRPLSLDKINLSQTAGFFAALVIMVSGILISTFIYIQTYRHNLSQQHIEQQHQLENLKSVILPSLLMEDRISLNLLVSDWAKAPGTNAIKLMDKQGQVLVSNGVQEGKMLSLAITQNGEQVGVIESYTSTSPAPKAAGLTALLTLLVSALLSFIGGLITWQLTEKYRQYINSLTLSLQKWQTGRSLELPPKPSGLELVALHGELDEIGKADNQKKAVQDALDQFMGGNDANPPDPMKYYNCALLFIEIQDLELLQNRLNAKELTQVLNDYHRLLSRAAKLYNGTVDRYLGDGVVMMFGLPNEDKNAALHCLYAARLFTGLINHLRESKSSLLPLEFNIAAHWGPVLMAPIQDNGTTQYSLIGDTIHWAYHLACHSEERRVLVSETILNRVENESDINWHSGPEIKDLHGHTQKSFWLDALPEKNESLIQRQIQHITNMSEKA